MDVTETAQLAIGGMVPDRIVSPADEREAAEALETARREGSAVVAVGGGTMLQVGEPPRRYDIALSTARLTGVLEYAPADLTIVARAGTTLEELQRELAVHGQFLPLDAPFPERATLGGVLAARTGGLWRTAYGSARDLVIGMRVALPSGVVAKSGGRVVKNVAGYDLAKLFIGSFGTLGVIVEVAFKIYPRPAVMKTLVVPAESLETALRLASRLRAGPSGLISVAAVDGSLGSQLGLGGAAVVVLAGGTARGADETVASVRSLDDSGAGRVVTDDEAGALLAALRDFPASATARLSTTPGRLGEALAWDDVAGALLYPHIGLAYVAAPEWAPEHVTRARQRVAPTRGSVVLLSRSPALEGVSTWGDVGPELALMRRVKTAFDPEDVLSPGRFVSGL